MGVAYIHIYIFIEPLYSVWRDKAVEPPLPPLVWISHPVLDAFSEQSENSTEM